MGLDMLSPTEGWAVGYRGTILHWQGDHWDPPVAGSGFPGDVIEASPMTSGDYEAWAEGHDGEAYHWIGGAWQIVPAPWPSDMRVEDIAIVSPGDSWAIAAESDGSSNFLHWDGAQWLATTQPSDNVHLTDLDMVSASDGWAVGSNLETLQPAMVRWNGAAWTPVPVQVAQGRLTVIEMLSEDEGWIGGQLWGDGVAAQPLLLRWDGVSWTPVPVPNPSGYEVWFVALDFASATDGWTVGFDTTVSGPEIAVLYHWDGSAWSLSQTTVSNIDFYARTYRAEVELASTTGWMTTADSDPLMQLRCGSWVPAWRPPTPIWDLALVSETEGWAVGSHLLHYKVKQVPEFVCMYFPFLAFTY
jgi:hypothetical protein